jgi:hypothetical protein
MFSGAARRGVRCGATGAATTQLGSLRVAPLVVGCWQLAGGHGREVFDNLQVRLLTCLKPGVGCSVKKPVAVGEGSGTVLEVLAGQE